MDSNAGPEKWKELMAAFRAFNSQAATKYRNMPKKTENEAASHAAETPRFKATPAKHASDSRDAKLNVSMGTASTVMTSPNSGKPRNPVETLASSVSSGTSKKNHVEVNKQNTRSQTNDIPANRAEKLSTSNSIPIKSYPILTDLPRDTAPEDQAVSPASKPSMSVSFSVSTIEPRISEQLEPEDLRSGSSCQEAKETADYHVADDMDSSGSDEIVFRQDEHNMVGPRLHARKQGVEQDKGNPVVAQRDAGKESGDPSIGQSVPNAEKNKNAPVKVFTIEEKRAKLQRLQERELHKIRMRLLEPEEDEISAKSLKLAREGPGTSPDSEISHRIRSFVLEPPKGINLALPDSESASHGHHRSTGIVVARSTLTVPEDHREASIELRNNSDFQPVLVDWQYRPWDIHDDEWTKRFADWLECTIRLGSYVEIHSGPFTNADFHPDGVTGFVELDFEAPTAHLDMSIPENAHAHETSAGYVYNWNLRLEHEKAKEIEEKKRNTAHVRAVAKMRPEPHPFAPKTNVYLRPVEAKDIPGLTKLYNWYIKNSTRCIELDDISEDVMKIRVDENEAAGFPCLIAAEHKPGRGYPMNSENEMIYGFIMASEFSGKRTANRYAAELELFVNPTQYNRRVGRSLLDKMIDLCDPKYTPKRGYNFDCVMPKRSLYCGVDVRPLSRLVVVVHHSADEVNEYRWLRRWMEQEFGFVEQGLLQGTAVKQRKVLNSAYLVRNTPLQPETKGDNQVVQWRFR
ncbi:hypothetical protein CPC735_008990 [Coccidioides posadasii C735 delta SOWgp]|uniref:N-acetyltransferase domain-containing protein n=1 Tax=Coccidioides posadasii (strain C735) TaxID=222929 RepID=C5PAG2_COCP7|nr:hypothetical protein CPC735_008990 [Coccidioides posadasii C735 delta SOWgp]EER26724.1 hypothetical protein CPC735_008990 [Coccidioides posadasii C735 delta SOWgp]|eukprot:XP_003068869.1 hypothetical protein CPC735_008990 [Coccidioides posadasii C735 delta SOWgp]